MHERLRYWVTPPSRLAVIIPIAYMSIIYFLSSLPGDPSSGHGKVIVSWIPDSLQNMLHIPLFGGLAWLWQWSLLAWKRNAQEVTLIAACITILYGGFDEWHQLTVPGRYATVSDFVLNIIGVITALWFYARVARAADAY